LVMACLRGSETPADMLIADQDPRWQGFAPRDRASTRTSDVDHARAIPRSAVAGAERFRAHWADRIGVTCTDQASGGLPPRLEAGHVLDPAIPPEYDVLSRPDGLLATGASDLIRHEPVAPGDGGHGLGSVVPTAFDLPDAVTSGMQSQDSRLVSEY